MAAKTCRICQNRKVGQGVVRGTGDTDKGTARNLELCIPCLAEAGWENTHSDDGHGTDYEGSNSTDDCWVCHPELNEASATYTPRVGTSRAGMRMTVPIRSAAKAKAQAVINQLPEGYATGVRTLKGTTTLKAAKAVGDGVILRWDVRGRFLSGEANGKKVRNASEALRRLGV